MATPPSLVVSVDETLVNMDAMESMGEVFNAGAGNQGGLAAPPRSITPMSDCSQDSCHADLPLQKGELEVVVKSAASIRPDLKRNNSAIDAGMPVYKMSSNPRGLALIIEIEEYENNVQVKRTGSHVDVDNLTKLFKQLHFKVEHRQNLTRLEFYQTLEAFAGLDDHREADMMILAVLSHGRDGHVFATDGTVVEVETIYEKFNNMRCPHLRGKPKFFIIQACRGDNSGKYQNQCLLRLFLTILFSDFAGLAHLEDERLIYERELQSRKRRIGTARDAVASDSFVFGELNAARPTWEDMIIAYSTIPGFTSLRDHDKGTWFIQSLVEVFMNHAHEKELIDLLRMTSDYLSRFTNDQGEKQTCNVEMRHLYKRIYFNPGFFMRKNKSGSPAALRRSLSTPPASPLRVRHQTEDDDDE